MKEVLIVTNKLVIGGIEKSLLEMVRNLPLDKLNITIMCIENGGELEKVFPTEIKIIRAPIYNSLLKIQFNCFKELKVVTFIKNMLIWMKLKRTDDWMKSNILGIELQSKLKTKYDIAIAYSTPISKVVPYVINNVVAEKKVMWIHSDVNLFQNQMNYYHNYYNNYDKIFGVSSEVVEKFKIMYPNLSDKVEVFYNIISDKKIWELSENGESFDDDFDGIRILTVARITDEKGHEFIPGIMNKIRNNGMDVKWYWIGNGIEKDKFEELIVKYDLEDRIILLGSKSNPYKYIRDCDLYVQPSLYECYCTTITEAKCLNKPIIFTNVNGAKEQIKNGVTGVLVEYDEDEIYKTVKRLIEDKNLRRKLSSNLKDEKISTVEEVDKLVRIIL